MSTPRDVARRVLERIERDGAWATPTLDGELARSGLDDRDRRLASELVYGVLRHRSRLDRALAAHAELKRTPPRVLIALRLAAYQLLFLDRVPAYAAVDDAVAAAREAAGDKLAGFVNAVLRKLDQAKEPPLPVVGVVPDGTEAARPTSARTDTHSLLARLEIEHSLPRWILDELFRAIGGRGAAIDEPMATELAARAAAFAEPAPLVGRVNVRKATRDGVGEELRAAGVTVTPIEIDGRTPAAIRIEGLGDPARNAAFIAGRWTVQDAGAQLVAQLAAGLAAPRAGQRILDACAGVGGKSTHLAELTDDAAIIDAADLNATKLGLLAETAVRLGLHSIRRHSCDLLDRSIWADRAGVPAATSQSAATLAASYDLIVLDAPCTGLGVLRRHPDAKWRLKPDDVRRMADLQRQLLDAVVAHLAPGGVLIYSVCTFTRAEGSEQAAACAQRHGLQLVEEHRSWPPDADAFYVAAFRAPAHVTRE
jgi:16S rRNA (cytosine967-C5)-methyltransferase